MAARYAARGIKRVGNYRSGLEEKNMARLDSMGVKAKYESFSIPYVVPASNHKYTPDALLPNGIIVEFKGLFEAEDRRKHLLIREQFPELDIRIVFSSSRTKLYKGSPTSYGEWAEKHGIKFADKLIPADWLKESKKDCLRRGRRSDLGSGSPNAKLTEEQLEEILKDTRSQQKIAGSYGVSQTLISLIKRGKVWQHVMQQEVSKE